MIMLEKNSKINQIIMEKNSSIQLIMIEKKRLNKVDYVDYDRKEMSK